MSLPATKTRAVSATVSLWIPRGEAGDLQDGVVGVLGAIDGVEDVTVEEVTSMRPTWTDIRVTADVTLVMTGPREAGEGHLRATLCDGFGVTGVEALIVRSR